MRQGRDPGPTSAEPVQRHLRLSRTSPLSAFRGLKWMNFSTVLGPMFKRIQTNFDFNSADLPGVSRYVLPTVISQFDPVSFLAPCLA